MFKLVKLYSNMSTFHPVPFKNGLNIVLGKQTGVSGKTQKTTNGIGKSLIIKLVDFCLGSDKRKEWIEPLAGWIFYLDIEIDGKIYKISRSIDEQRYVLFDNKRLTLAQYRDLLKTELNLSQDFSFRQYVNRFLRKGKKAYISYFTTVPGEKDSQTLLVICYLLGLRYDLVKEKINLKQQLDSNLELLKKTKNDPAFRSIFGIDKYDIDLELSNVDFDIERLSKEISQFRYAENYSEEQSAADKISETLDELHKELYFVEENIQSISESLSREIDTKLDHVKQIYQETQACWSEGLQHSLLEVEEFHKELLKTRKAHLSAELLKQQERLNIITKEIEKNNKLLNDKLNFLKAHSAIDKYVVLVRQIDALREKKKELLKIAGIEKEIKSKIDKIKSDIATSNIKAQIYLDSIESKCGELNRYFVSLGKQIYTDKKCAFSIKNNDGINQIRFNLDARITSDGSDGVQEVITFCFDWILLNEKITKQAFLYHDSLLLANVARQQKEMLFILSNQMCLENNMQYIININEDQIDNFTPEVRQLIYDNVILQLADDSVKSKLLGVEVDLGKDT